MVRSKSDLTNRIKTKAQELGFVACGIAESQELTQEARYLEAWLNQSHHGTMSYLAQHFEKRIDPRLLVEGAKSILSLSYNYYTEQTQSEPDAPKIAMYALGRDYHLVVKEKLEILLTYIKSLVGEVNGRCFVDTAPILERTWAQRSGVGWIGKNTLLLTKHQGSYFFLGEIILDIPLDYDSPVKDYCGNCTRCIDACPTQALSPYKMDASKCISYLTIEMKEENIPSQFQPQMNHWIYGCDICQQVCPINSQATPHTESDFTPNSALRGMTTADWRDLTQENYQKLFKNSAIKRAKYKGLMRNIKFVLNK